LKARTTRASGCTNPRTTLIRGFEREISLHAIRQRPSYNRCHRDGAIGIGRSASTVVRIVDKDRAHSKPSAGFNVTEGIADHHAVSGVRAGKVAEGLLEQSWKRLAAIALADIVGTIVDGVQGRALECEFFL